MKKLLFTTVLTVITLFAFSQKYLSGYILTLEGDTVRGMLKDQSDLGASKKCFFKTKDGNETVYLPFEIKEYMYDDQRYFIPKRITIDSTSTDVFLRLLLQGAVNLYMYDNPMKTKERYFIEKDGILTELVNNEKDVYIDGAIHKRSDNKYIGILKYLYNDAPSIANDIDKISFTPSSIIKVTEKYHNAICNGETCAIYKDAHKKIFWGINPIVSYSFNSIKVDQSHYKRVETGGSYTNLTIYEYSRSESYTFNSSTSFSYGLGISVFSPDKRFRIKYSLLRNSSTFNTISYSNSFPLSITDYPDVDINNITSMKIEELENQVLLSYTFTKYRMKPFVSSGFAWSKKIDVSNEKMGDILFIEDYRGFILSCGTNYKLNESIYLELGITYSEKSGSNHKTQGTGAFTDTYTFDSVKYDASLKQIGISLSANIILNNKKKDE